MYERDRREEFKDVPWQQGRLLMTNNTRHWSKEQRDEDRAELKEALRDLRAAILRLDQRLADFALAQPATPPAGRPAAARRAKS